MSLNELNKWSVKRIFETKKIKIDKENLGPLHVFVPCSIFINFFSRSFFTDPPPKCKKNYCPLLDETFQLLLLGCQYGHAIIRTNTHKSNKICEDVFITNNIQSKYIFGYLNIISWEAWFCHHRLFNDNFKAAN